MKMMILSIGLALISFSIVVSVTNHSEAQGTRFQLQPHITNTNVDLFETKQPTEQPRISAAFGFRLLLGKIAQLYRRHAIELTFIIIPTLLMVAYLINFFLRK